MNYRQGRPEGTTGTVQFDGRIGRRPAVRDSRGVVWVPSVNRALWLRCNVRHDQFEAAS